MNVITQKTQQSFAEFYTAYLTDHTDRTSRQLHFFWINAVPHFPDPACAQR